MSSSSAWKLLKHVNFLLTPFNIRGIWQFRHKTNRKHFGCSPPYKGHHFNIFLK